MSESIVIVSAARTPIGGLLGDFAALPAWQLGAVAIRAAVERAGVAGDGIDEVLLLPLTLSNTMRQRFLHFQTAIHTNPPLLLPGR